MTETTIAAPLAAALAAKGYETLTPVQSAMLGAEVAGRDLLVSAQTGSGKTVAFGIAMAPELLAGQDELLYADVPQGLVIAPTRELALQVARELGWLYEKAGAKIATCVGGMDYRTERRALERGAHLVVGTPGRLRDHIERGGLDLSGLKAVVLDEADEMLDLGFAEDLEFILAAAPEGRRTLMFSATVPKEIEKLAATFQKDALRIQTAGEAKQHVDIEYRAFSVAAREKEHAIFNVLRFYEARTAIVFCKTRANVNHLLARMGNRGFQVVALSGELSQQERTHALQALRDGRARICVATDVAARGIDLPGLELVVHADLPSNPDTMLHRSGRTGRAGRKGVSALIVTPAEFKKAQRVLQTAKVVAEWGPAPGADDVQARDDVRIMEHPALLAGEGEEATMAERLIERFGAEAVAAAFVRMWREGHSAPEVLSSDAPVPPASERVAKPRGEFGAAVWYELSVGHSGRAEARWLLPKICEAGGVAKDAIGAIRVQQDRTFVQIAEAQAARFGTGVELEAGLSMARIDGEPSLDRPSRPSFGDRPERAPRKTYDRADKPAYTPKPSRYVDDGQESAPRKPYAPREDGERKPYARRDDAERKPYAPRGDSERKPYAPREDGERKPYARRDDSERKPYAPREDGERKPYARRDDSDRKPYAPRGDTERKPYGARTDAERKPYARRDEGDGTEDRKPRWKAGDRPDGKPAPKSAGYKSFGSKEGRATGFKSHAAEGTGYKPKSDSADRPAKRPYAAKGDDARPYARPAAADGAKPRARTDGFKSHKPDGKSFGAKPAAKPRTDARDTSKRFVPPKKPKV